jgi:hypothetical protein
VLRRRTHAGRTDASFRATASAAVSTQYETQLVYGSTAQLAQIGLESCTSATSLRTHAVTLRNVSPGEYGIASLGGVTRILDGSAPVFPLWFEDVPAGPVDLFASRTVPGGPASRVLIVRDLELESGSLVTTNFNGTASDTAKTAAVEIAGASGDDLEVFTDLVTKNSHGGLWFDLAPGPATVRTWSGLPTEAMQHGEFHSLVVFATPVGSDDFRYVQKHVIPVSFQSLALGPAINAPVSTQVTGDPHPRFRFTGDLGNLYTGSVIIEVLPSHEAGNAFNIHATGAYLAAAGTQQAYDFTMPDVTGLAGYPTASRLTTGANRVTVSAFEFTGPGIFEVQPIPGTMIRASVRNITVIVP